MLQKRCKDILKAKDLIEQSDGSEKGNQALHLLSEVATGNSGQNDNDKNENNRKIGVADGAKSKQYPAKLLVERLLDIDDEDAKSEMWLEEVMQGFH